MVKSHARLICGTCNTSIDSCVKCGQIFEMDERIGCNSGDHLCEECIEDGV